jgi:hypothetical protein
MTRNTSPRAFAASAAGHASGNRAGYRSPCNRRGRVILVVTEAVRYGVGYITGNEPGTDRLKSPATASDDGLTLTVESVTYTDHFTRVRLAARNETETALSLPLFGYCVLIGADGTTLQADPFRSRWSDTLAPGSLQCGTIHSKVTYPTPSGEDPSASPRSSAGGRHADHASGFSRAASGCT